MLLIFCDLMHSGYPGSSRSGPALLWVTQNIIISFLVHLLCHLQLHPSKSTAVSEGSQLVHFWFVCTKWVANVFCELDFGKKKLVTWLIKLIYPCGNSLLILVFTQKGEKCLNVCEQLDSGVKSVLVYCAAVVVLCPLAVWNC